MFDINDKIVLGLFMNETIKIIAPAGMNGASAMDTFLDAAMRKIAIATGEPNDFCEKYGAEYANKVFMMHPFCWCEKSSCAWCGEQRAPNFYHKATGFKVWWYKYIGRSVEVNKELTKDELDKIEKECIESLKETNGERTK